MPAAGSSAWLKPGEGKGSASSFLNQSEGQLVVGSKSRGDVKGGGNGNALDWTDLRSCHSKSVTHILCEATRSGAD